MKFETTAKLLTSALRTVGQVIENRNTIPILGTVLFDGRTIRGTNLDMEIEIAVPATAATGKACIAHRPLLNLVRHIPGDDTVSIEAGKDGATVTFSTGRYDLPSLRASDYPDLQLGELRDVAIDGEALKKALAFVAPFISTEETRYYLNGVCLDGAVAVATDGHRLGCHPLGFDGAPFDRCIVPRQVVAIFGKLPAPKAIQIATGKPGMSLTLDGAAIRTKLIDGTFPDWRLVVPQAEPASTLTLERAGLLRVMRRMAPVLTDRGTGSTLAWGGEHVVLAGKNSPGGVTAREYVGGATIAGKPGVASFSARYIVDMLGAFGCSGTVTLSIIDSGSPSIWRGEGEAYGVLMPLRGAHNDLASATLAEWAKASEIGRAA